jgi:hypothetical protein
MEKNNKAALSGLGLGAKTWDEESWVNLMYQSFIQARKDISAATEEKQAHHVRFHAAQAAAYAGLLMLYYSEKDLSLSKQWHDRYSSCMQQALTRRNKVAEKLGSRML